jgi:heat shock protein beta
MAGVGEKPEDLARSPFVERLFARGYEVLLLSLPSDEPMMSALGNFMWVAGHPLARHMQSQSMTANAGVGE